MLRHDNHAETPLPLVVLLAGTQLLSCSPVHQPLHYPQGQSDLLGVSGACQALHLEVEPGLCHTQAWT